MSDSHTSVAAKLARLVASVGDVPKSGYNDYLGYEYHTEADIFAAIREPIEESDLLILPSITHREITDVEVIGDSGQVTGLDTRAIADVQIRVIDTETGEQLVQVFTGEGRDQGDKAIAKAYTMAMRYWAQKTFRIGGGPDPESDTSVDKRSRQRPANGRSSGGSGGQYESKKLEDVMGFGQYEDKTVQWVCENDRDYLKWLLEESDDFGVKQSVIDYAAEQAKKEEASENGQQSMSPPPAGSGGKPEPTPEGAPPEEYADDFQPDDELPF